MKKQILALVPMVCLFASGIEATPIIYVTNLSGLNENPPVATPGFGLATVIFDIDAHTMEVTASFQDLIGTTTQAHIHCCADPPINVGVATQLPSFTSFPLGVTFGVYSHLFDTSLASTWNNSFIVSSGGTVAQAEARLAQGLADGQAYFNVHTNFRPGGEIRGILAVPEPGTIGLILLGLGTLVAARRKRRA